jgi:hypothetical protein
LVIAARIVRLPGALATALDAGRQGGDVMRVAGRLWAT